VRNKITNFVLNKIHIMIIAKHKWGWEGRTIRYSRLRKFKKKGNGLLIAAKIVALWYLLILSGSYLTADTGAYFNDVETISNSLATAENYCADEEWAKEHPQYCKDNAGIGNGCEAVDDCDSEKGEDEDNPGQNPDDCGDHTNAPCTKKVTDVTETHTESSITLTWKNPTDNQFDSIKIIKDGNTSPVVENLKGMEFEDKNLSPSTKFTYQIIAVGKNGKELGSVTIEVTTNEAVSKGESSDEGVTTVTETDKQPPGEVTTFEWTEQDGNGKIDFKWMNPHDKDFSYIRIYKDDNLLVDNIKDGKFTHDMQNTEANFKITTVDQSGNESQGVTLNVTRKP
jgi:predicted ribosomally synthesized peptide with SipW-like signal peptide